MKCTMFIKLPEQKYFHGCDGKPISDSLLKLWLEKAIKDENYELAANCKKEIERRCCKIL